jgi:RHS repeat-associated protein
MRVRQGKRLGSARFRGISNWWLAGFVGALGFVAGLSGPYRQAAATAELTGWGVGQTGPHSGPTSTLTPFGAADPPAIYHEAVPAQDAISDSVGATPGSFRVDETGASTYSVPIYMPPGTAGMSPKLSFDYHSRGGNGPMGPGWNLGGLSAITRCRKASEFGDGAGPFPPINFDAATTNDAYCLDGARLITGGPGSCPAGPSGSTATVYGLETDPSVRVCAYSASGITGPSRWLVQPKDGSWRRYGAAGNSALVRNNGQGMADATQILTWALDRLADASGNLIEFVYAQSSTTGELNLSEVDYTGKVNPGDALTASTYTRAPYNKVTFTYGAQPANGQRVDYVSGMKVSLTQQLTTVTVQGTANNGASPDALQTVRTYHLNYGATTESGLPTLTDLRECAPNGAGEVCYPRTTFQWNGGSNVNKGFPTVTTSASYSSTLGNAIDFKVGDINGDGRQDLIWLKDGACDSSGSGATRFQLMTSIANSAGFGAPTATGVYLNRPATFSQGTLPGCGGDFTTNHFETIWFLYDFTGDGREDLLASTGSAWTVYPTVAASGGGWKFDPATAVATGISALADDDGKVLDLNADGLPDLLHATSDGIAGARYLHRATSGTLAFSFDATDTPVDIDTPPAPGGTGFVGLSFATARKGNPPAGDLDGDGAADLVIKAAYQASGGDGDCPGLRPPGAGSYRIFSSLGDSPDALLCKYRWFTYRNAGIQGNGHLKFATDVFVGEIGTGGIAGNGTDIFLADLNGDGQADLLYRKTDGTYQYRLNAGKADNAASGDRYLAEQSVGLTLSDTMAPRLQLLDENGDRRLDLFYLFDATTSFPLKARLFGGTGFGAEFGVGNSTFDAQALGTLSLLVDTTGDGAPDLIRFASGTLKIAENASAFGGNDFVTAITNGLGASSQVLYYPLTFNAVYSREFDGPSKTWGRGAPVFDVFSSLWVVRSAFQSAPTGTDSNAQSFVLYKYGGARIQAGGRGYLGFKTVQTEDLQNSIVSTTEYRQDFPFIGRPLHTVVEKESSPLPDPCAVNPHADGCFSDPPPNCGPSGCPIAPPGPSSALLGVGGQVLSDAANTWTSVPAFNPATVQPVMPYLSAADEQKFDLATAGAFTHGVSSTYSMDANGNLLSATVISTHGDAFGTAITDETKTTNNVYGCTVSPPTVTGCVGGSLNAEAQRLGRLSIATVSSARAGQTTVTRRASFEYDATTRLLVSEIQGPYDDAGITVSQKQRWGLRTDYVLDADGNRIEQVVCSTSDFANRTACLDLSGFQQRQWSTPLTKIQRFTKWDYEPKGRFLLDTKVPFYSTTDTAHHTAESVSEYIGIALAAGGDTLALSKMPLKPTDTIVINRTAFGDPINRIASTGMGSDYGYGYLGRTYFSRSTVGTFQSSLYRWCQDVVNADVPSGSRVNCPAGARFRLEVASVASAGQTGAGGIPAGASIAPTSYAYFDVLGREVLKTTRIYQSGASTDRWSSVASTYDSTGRTKTVSVEYFSADPTAAQGGATTRAGAPLHGTPAVAQTTYDAINRASFITVPETPANGASETDFTYDKLTTTVKNARTHQTVSTMNGRGEGIQTVDDSGLAVTYGRDAAGNLNSVSRQPSDGDSAGITITNTSIYDRLGRRTLVTDPDKGSWSYDYNALGEVITQTDAKNQIQTLYRDALGRLVQRTETRAVTGGGTVSEPASSWEYDTDARDGSMGATAGTPMMGVLHTEANGTGGFSRSTHYDDVGRVSSVATSLDGTNYTEVQTYDAVGRPFQHFDPSTTSGSADGELTEYSTDGYPVHTRDSNNNVSGQLYNEVLAMTQRGQVRQEKFHNAAALTTTRTYDDNTGRLLTLSTGSAGALQFWDYTYDKHTNLTRRWNHTTGLDVQEDFEYDGLDRLLKITPTRFNGPITGTALNVGYDQLGNLKTKSNGTTTYTWTYAGAASGCARPTAGRHAVSAMGGASFCYDANGNQTNATYVGGATHSITYTGYDFVESVTTNGFPSAATESFKYAPDRSMWKRAEGPAAGSDRIFCSGFEATPCAGSVANANTYYVNNVEVRMSGGVTTTKRYIGGYLAITATSGSSTPRYDYLFRDVLGSLDVIASETGAVRQRLSFDAWGQRRYAAPSSTDYFAWLMPAASAASFDTSATYQGFTGHQQLDPVGLVHMKGRLYDPALGRFIQADPFTDRDATQGLNRYSYVMNNPLSKTDPTGYLSFRQWLGLAIAIVASVVSQQYWVAGEYWASFCVAVAGGFTSAYVATGSVRAGLWGAFSAGVFWGIGAAFSQEFAYDNGFSCTAEMTQGAQWAKVAAHGAAGGVLNELQGGNFGSGFLAAGATQAASPAIDGLPGPAQFVASAAVGGVVSQATGGSFGNGATTAAFQYLFNTAVHATIAAQGARIKVLTNADDAAIPAGGYSNVSDAITYVSKEVLDASAASPGKFEYGGAVVEAQGMFFPTSVISSGQPGYFEFNGIDGLKPNSTIAAIVHIHPEGGLGGKPTILDVHDVRVADVIAAKYPVWQRGQPGGFSTFIVQPTSGDVLGYTPGVTATHSRIFGASDVFGTAKTWTFCTGCAK